ncbi:MAG TPA: hypothetical protein VFO05_14175 [Candidatus Limnocylindrales bacterium]|nr:hypothetical protein [Candidatus Limnocylindrales bacterium]
MTIATRPEATGLVTAPGSSGLPGALPATGLAGAGAGPDGLHTEYAFVLPRGYVDGSGAVHRDGVMRLATARDEIIPQRDPRVRENEAYLTILLLSRVVTRLGSLPQVHTGVIEGLFASDLAFLQDLYRRVNQEGHTQASVTCPACNHGFTVDVAGEQRLGES